LTPKRGTRTRLARETASALRRLTRPERAVDLSDFEPVFPREAIRSAQQDELKLLYDQLDGMTINVDDI
jgi:hypothetical protein